MPVFTRDLERTLQRALSIADGEGQAPRSFGRSQVTDSPSKVHACDRISDICVLLQRDDFRPDRVVVKALRDAFRNGGNDSARLTLDVYPTGSTQRGASPLEITATEVAAVAQLARDLQHPLHRVMETTRGPSDALLFTQPRTIAASGPGDRQRA